MKNVAEIIPECVQPIETLFATAYQSSLPPATIGLVHMRISPINGCAQGIDGGAKHAKKMNAVREWSPERSHSGFTLRHLSGGK
jgi:alkylhydroperoxidase family enzyme